MGCGCNKKSKKDRAKFMLPTENKKETNNAAKAFLNSAMKKKK